jgi:hypothetical protein
MKPTSDRATGEAGDGTAGSYDDEESGLYEGLWGMAPWRKRSSRETERGMMGSNPLFYCFAKSLFHLSRPERYICVESGSYIDFLRSYPPH